MDVHWRQGICGILLTFLLAACGSGSSSGSSDQGSQNPPPPPPPPPEPELANLAPASLSFDLEAGESENVTISFSNTGDAALTYELTTSANWLSLPANATGSLDAGANAALSVTATCGNDDLSGDLVLTTNDADEGTNTIPATAVCTVPVSNFEITRVLMNQAARAFDSDQAATPSIDLIAGRDLLVRAFVTGSGAVPEGRVVVSRSGQQDLIYPMQTPTSVGPNPGSEAVLNQSHRVVVPGAAVQNNASIRVEIEPFANPAVYPESGNVALNAVDAGSFNVTFVPVTFNGQTPSIDVNDYMRRALQVLPIGDMDIEVRTPYVFTQAYDLETILTDMADLRDQDGSNRLYHGVVIPPGGSGSQTAGIGYVGFPVSVSIDLGGEFFVIAHEMGHNLNLGHAPGCDAPNPDPNYPNPGAEVTTWGWNITANALVEPTANKRDFMSYCNDLWVSDYHFDRAIDYRGQSPRGFGPPAERGMTVSGLIDADGVTSVRMLPTAQYRLPEEGGEHALRFRAWDASGALLIETSFASHTVADKPGGRLQGFSFNVPQPAAAIHHYEISDGEQVLYTSTAAASVRANSSVAVNWQTQGPRLTWSPAEGETLVVRNDANEVIAMDRSGSVDLSTAGAARIEIANHGQTTATAEVRPGADIRWQRVN